jgi:hypothetical protein
VTAELAAFASCKREGVLMGGASTFTVDIEMAMSTAQEMFESGGIAFEPAPDFFNAFNTGAYTQWDTGAKRRYSSTYLAVSNRHPLRASQLSVSVRL